MDLSPPHAHLWAEETFSYVQHLPYQTFSIGGEEEEEGHGASLSHCQAKRRKGGGGRTPPQLSLSMHWPFRSSLPFFLFPFLSAAKQTDQRLIHVLLLLVQRGPLLLLNCTFFIHGDPHELTNYFWKPTPPKLGTLSRPHLVRILDLPFDQNSNNMGP